MSDCIFCKIGSKEIQAMHVYEEEDLMAFRDINPQAPVHVLIIPKKHISSLNDFEPGDMALFAKMVAAGKHIAKQEKIAGSGFVIETVWGQGYRAKFDAPQGVVAAQRLAA